MPQQPKTREEEMQQRYRNVFANMEGRIVLGDILTMGHFDVPLNADEPERLGERSLAVTIARMAGAFDQIYLHLSMDKKDGNGPI